MLHQVVRCYPFGELISDTDVVGGEIILTGLDLTPFYDVRLYLAGLKVNTNDNKIALQMELGGSVVSSGYYDLMQVRDAQGNTANVAGSSLAYVRLVPDTANYGVGTDAGQSLSCYLCLGNPVGTQNKSLYGHVIYRRGLDHMTVGYQSAMLDNTSNVTGFRIYCPDVGGSLTAGRAFLMALG